MSHSHLFFLPFIIALPEFFLGDNPFYCDCEMEWLQKINQMAHRGTHPRVMDLDNVQCRLNNNKGHESSLPLMRVHNSQFLCPYQAHCFALCMCCDFFACDCRMQCPEGCSCFHDSTWSANVIQCSSRGHTDVPPLIPMDATSIHLDGNNFTGTLESQAFIGRKRVSSLFLNASMIGAINNQTFNGLTELEVLHLEDNLIHSLQGYEFGNLTSLKELYLQRNKLAYIDSNTFSALASLEILHLHDNLLTLQPVWEWSAQLPALRTLTLSSNPWSCQCDYVSRFVMYTNSQVSKIIDESSIQCQPTDQQQPPKFFLADANSTCTDALAITLTDQSWSQVLSIAISLTALCIVIAVVSVIFFVFRTPLRVWLHSKYGVRMCSCIRNRKSEGGGQSRDKLYDAFVSYSLKDEDFVNQVLVGQLEQSEEPSYKLCLQHRDLPNNSSIADTYSSIATLCAKQVLVVSLSFLESEWPKIKYSVQDLRKWKPLLIVTQELSSLDLAKNPEFNILMKTAVVIRWSEAGFWNKLKYYLPDAVAHFTYRRNINLNNSSTMQVQPHTPKLTDRLTSTGSPRPSINMQQLYHTNQQQSRQPQRGHPWSYEAALIPSNNSSTSTRSTVTNGGSPRTLSSTEESSVQQPPPPAPTNSGGVAANILSNPLDPLNTSIEGLEQWSDRSDSAFSWHDHTYQTIPIHNAAGEPIYHTLEPEQIPVMLPNGRICPATLVRNSSGRVMPLVQVSTPTASSASTTFTTTASSRSPAPIHSQVTFPKTIVYKSPASSSASPPQQQLRSGYLV